MSSVTDGWKFAQGSIKPGGCVPELPGSGHAPSSCSSSHPTESWQPGVRLKGPGHEIEFKNSNILTEMDNSWFI